jgi:hypothetical protein
MNLKENNRQIYIELNENIAGGHGRDAKPRPAASSSHWAIARAIVGPPGGGLVGDLIAVDAVHVGWHAHGGRDEVPMA